MNGHEYADFLVIGSGIAGLSAAITASRAGTVVIFSKDEPRESNTEYAQGGIAAALSDEDEVSFHFRDTLEAGDGLCDSDAVHILVGEGPGMVNRLIEWGTEFDKEKTKLVFTREAAHSRRRVLHAGGDSTGKEIVRALLVKASSIKNITIKPFHFTVDLLSDESGRIIGAEYINEKTKETNTILASAVILASGGAGRVYRETTNPELATGDGIAAAARAGAILQDMEFVQFHPTSLHITGAPRFLLTEAIRGEGGLLLNVQGKRFMDSYHPKAELAPRDIVSRAIIKEMEKTDSANVYLDVTHLKGINLQERFPQVFQNCLYYGLDIRKDYIPVAPAAHYYIGGVRTDILGRSSLSGLFAAGETACTGVHGANRLASNSLLEGLVFGIRSGRSAVDFFLLNRLDAGEKKRANSASGMESDSEMLKKMKTDVQNVMWENVGIVRYPERMEKALTFFKVNYQKYLSLSGSRGAIEVKNLFLTGFFTARAAFLREESRGAHYRVDFPDKNEERVHSYLELSELERFVG
jgi:L-aspartate oxidase